MNRHPASKRGRHHSFTLVELLVVIAIGAILAVLSVSAYGKINRALTITSSAQMLNSELNQARQTAVARNTDVEFRIYQVPDINAVATATPTVYRAFQSFLVVGATTNQLSKVGYLPTPAVIMTTATKSTVMNLGTTTGTTLNFSIPTYAQNYNALVFRFSPNGGLEPSTPMGSGSWLATLILQNDPITGVNGAGLPSDFATVEIDPFTGASAVYRP